MSKEADARVREELLQALYAGVLEAKLAHARAGRAPEVYDGSALAAGVVVNLRSGDLLLLPPRRGDSLRLLRSGALGKASVAASDLRAGVLELPREESAAVAMALGAAAALAHSARGAVVCVLTTETGTGRSSTGPRSRTFPGDWAGAGDWAARRALPLLLLSEQVRRGSAAFAAKAAERPAHLLPAPLFPTIPIDREDALAVYRVAFECLARARAGGGPSALQGAPFRARGQRVKAAANATPTAISEPDALVRLETMLRARGVFQASWKRQLERDLIRKLSA